MFSIRYLFNQMGNFDMWKSYFIITYFYDGSDSKESAGNAGDPGMIPGSERSPGGGNGNLLQYPCLENSMDRGV